METGMIKWEREKIDVAHNFSNWRQDTIWLTSASGKKGKLNKMTISANLVREAGLKCGDSIWLYKSGNLFMIRKEPSDFVFRMASGGTNMGDGNHALSLTNANFVAHLNWIITGATEYDAWVDGTDILFKAREVK